MLEPAALKASAGTTLTARKDGSILASGQNPAVEEYAIEARLPAGGMTAIRVEALPDASLPRGGPGRDAYGNFFLNDVEAELVRAGGNERIWLPLLAADDGKLEDERSQQLWVVDASREDQRLPRQFVLTSPEPFGAAGDTLRVRIRQKSQFGGQGLGCFRLSVTGSAKPETIVGVSAKLRGVLLADAGQRSEEDSRRLAEYYRSVAPSLEPARERQKELRKELGKLGIVSTLIMGEAPGFERPSTAIRTRGMFTSPGEQVYAAVPSVLPPLPDSAMPNRLGLARWLVSPENPLTARVTVNRIWETYFGRGIVETTRGFRVAGTSAHASRTARLAGHGTHRQRLEPEEAAPADRDLLHLPAIVRGDARASGARPVQPPAGARAAVPRGSGGRARYRARGRQACSAPSSAGRASSPTSPRAFGTCLITTTSGPPAKGTTAIGAASTPSSGAPRGTRRCLTFDGTSREICVVRRIRTNTPLQALTTLNDPAFFEAAQAMAARILREGGASPRVRAEYGFRLCVARRPKAAEVDRILAAFDKERTWFENHRDEAARLARGAENAPELAAWTVVSNALLNLDETVTKE